MTGSYSSSTNLFTTSNSGSDTIYIFDADGTGNGTAYRAVVLVGYVDLAGNDSIDATGLFTAVVG
jgi:hypothetical protein